MKQVQRLRSELEQQENKYFIVKSNSKGSKPSESFLDTTDRKVKLKAPELHKRFLSYPAIGHKLVKNEPITVTGADSDRKIEFSHNAPIYNSESYFIHVDAIKNYKKILCTIGFSSLEIPENLPLSKNN